MYYMHNQSPFMMNGILPTKYSQICLERDPDIMHSCGIVQ